MGLEIVGDLVIKWDPDVRLGRVLYESCGVFGAASFYDSPKVRF